MRVAVVGATGFMGNRLCAYLKSQGHEVTAFSRRASKVKGVHSVGLDITQTTDFRPYFQKMDVVFNLANTLLPAASNEQPVVDVMENLVPAIRMAEAVLEVGVRKLVFASSGGTVYGEPAYLPIDEKHPIAPRNSYGVVKTTIEHYYEIFSQNKQLAYLSLRISNPYGPGQLTNRQQGVVGVFLDRIIRGEMITLWGNGQAIRDFIYIDDVIRAFEVGMELGTGVYNVGSGVGTRLTRLIKELEYITGKSALIHYVDGRSLDVSANVLDASKYRILAGWEPRVTLQDGLRLTYRSLLNPIN